MIGFDTINLASDLRLQEWYINGYVNGVWTAATIFIPFIALVVLSLKIFLGLRKVRMNLNRHKRLEVKYEANEAAGKQTGMCSIQVKVTDENGVGKSNS